MLQFVRVSVLLVGAIMAHFAVQAQTQTCGSEPTTAQLQHIKQLYSNISSSGFKTTDTVYIPIRAHFITRDDSTGALSYNTLSDEIDAINQFYKAALVQFFLCDSIHYIYSSDLYDFEKNVDEAFTADVYDEPNKLNIYFAGNLYRTSSSNDTTYLCGYAYFPPGPDRIFMDYSCSTNGSTLAHEIGHYMSLLHTHETYAGDELVDGSNCSSAGDFFCDTPADPNVNGAVNTSCLYTGNDTDDNGDAYMPDVTNLMSYSRKSCRDNFSPEQLQAVAYTAINDRNYLSSRPVPEFGVNTNAYTVQLSNFSTNATEYVWDMGDGTIYNSTAPSHTYTDTGSYTICLFATNDCKTYNSCINVDISCASFRANIIALDTSNTDLVVSFSTGLEDSADIYWLLGDGAVSFDADFQHEYAASGEYTVTLFVENGCGADSTSQVINVLSTVSVEDIAQWGDLSIYPNPATNSITVSSGFAFKGTYSLFDMMGRNVIKGSSSGPHASIDVSALDNGVYLLQLKDEKGLQVRTERIMISR